MYESVREAPLSRRDFALRTALHVVMAALMLGVSIGVGMAGYLYFEVQLTWRDAFLNATMLLGGMGPVDAPHTDGGKLFAGCYALYAGLVFIIVASVVLAPWLHRMLHQLHWQEDE